MLPVIALIGRPNVGKSTLFNRLTRSRDALVADFPGLTRDRQYGFGKLGPVPYLAIDTCGVAGGEVGIYELMVEQTVRALREADVAIVMVDGRSGLTAADEHVAELARKHAKKTWLAVNKAEGLDADIAAGEFHGLGLGEPVAISAAHGDWVNALMDEVLAPFVDIDDVHLDESEPSRDNKALRIAVIGRPNVGKSTLINRLIGEDRLVVFDQPGTTRDSVAVPFERDGRHYLLIDTAGVRRKSRVHEVVEKFSIIKALQAMERAQVVIALLDAREGVTEQDVSLMGLAVERGRALVVVTNKWDGLSHHQKAHVKGELDRLEAMPGDRDPSLSTVPHGPEERREEHQAGAGDEQRQRGSLDLAQRDDRAEEERDETRDELRALRLHRQQGSSEFDRLHRDRHHDAHAAQADDGQHEPVELPVVVDAVRGVCHPAALIGS